MAFQDRMSESKYTIASGIIDFNFFNYCWMYIIFPRYQFVLEAELLDPKKVLDITELFQCPQDLEELCLWLRHNQTMMNQLVYFK